MRQLRKASIHNSSLNTYTGGRQGSLPADRSFYKEMRDRRTKDAGLSYEEDYMDVAGVLILSTQVRVPQSRMEQDRCPGMRPRMYTI